MLVFANPAFLWALTAAAIPLMLHMFQRRRTVVTPFPTLRFLKAAQKRSSSRVRFENFLLWLLRTLLLLTLGFAFALPVLRTTTTGGSWLSRTRRDVAIVLDASYSMNYELDRGKVFEICKDAAVGVIEGLFSGDRVCVYVAADTPVPIIEKPTTEHATVIQAIRALTCQPGTSKLDETVAIALRALEQQDGRREREVYILTDGQALPWQGFRDAAKNEAQTDDSKVKISREQRDKVSFFALLGGAQQPDNAYPADVKVSPSLMLLGQTARLNVRVGAIGTAKQITVAVDVGGQERGRRSVSADAGTETSVEFAIGGLEPGIHIAKITTPQDALPEDDDFQFLLRVRKQLPVLIAGPQEATRYLKAALAPGATDDSVRQIDVAELESIDLRDYQAVFLCDVFPVSGQAVMRVEEYAKNGGVVIVFPGDRADVAAYADMKILPAQPKGTEEIPVELAARPLKRIPNQKDQVVNFNLSLPPGSVPTVALKRIMTFNALQENSAVLITAGDDVPFMIGRAVGRGRVFMFGTGANRDWSSFPLTAFFLPVVHQLIRQGAGASVQPPHLALGATVPVNDAVPNYRDDDAIAMPSGAQLLIKDNGNREFFIENLTEPGIYTRTKAGAGQPEPVLAVNTDRFESRLTPATAEELTEWTGFKKFLTAKDPEELTRLIDEYRNGRSLAEVFLWIALFLALLEWWFANRALRTQTGATEKMTVDLAGKVVTS
ncbi:MAG TPA: BatA domain-containing protein [Kiritimatiellia bacterium]|nr:BatA domain-containing protein [Kiritimatiellia bacterium]HPS05976.1 BatA domain-containing protein [Kiritimatiellia bacterium]